MVKEIVWDITRKHNQPCKLQPPLKDFEDVTEWLNSSKISYAVQADPIVYSIHIEEFWKTAKISIVNDVKKITAIVRNKKVVVTEDIIRRVLSLGDDHKNPLRLKKDDILDGFWGMRYVGDFRNKNEIKRKGLTKDWRFSLHVFAMSIAHRKGGYDGLNLKWSAAMLNLCIRQPFNISRLIFYCMADNANSSTWAMYPRFIQLIINDQHPNLPNDNDTYKF